MERTAVLMGIFRLVGVFALCPTANLARAQHVMTRQFGPGTGVQTRVAGRFQSYSGFLHGGHRASIVRSPRSFGVYWGSPAYGWANPYFAWRFGPGFVFAPYGYRPIYPYWYGSYPYSYGYGAWASPRDYNPPYRQCDYRYEDCDSSGQQSAVRPSSPKQSLSPPSSNPDLESPTDSDPDDSRATKLVAYRLPIRHEVRTAMNVLRRMPPSARQRWLASGRYNNFSLEEREALRRISDDRSLSTATFR